MIIRCADIERLPPARGVMVSTAALLAGLRIFRTGRTYYAWIFIFIVTIVTVITIRWMIVTAIFAVILITVLTVIVIAIVGISHKWILSAHKIASFINFGEAPLHCMLVFD